MLSFHRSTAVRCLPALTLTVFGALSAGPGARSAHATPPAPCAVPPLSIPTPAERLLQVADELDVRALKAQYTYALDTTIADASRVDDLMDLFTDDACVDYGSFGRYRGKAAIRSFFAGIIRAQIAWTFHSATDPLIDVGLTNAVARFHFDARAVMKAAYAAGPQLFVGVYDEEFVRSRGEWKIKNLVANFSVPPTGP